MQVRFFDIPLVVYFGQHKIKEEKNVTIQQWPLTYSTVASRMVVLIKRVREAKSKSPTIKEWSIFTTHRMS